MTNIYKENSAIKHTSHSAHSQESELYDLRGNRADFDFGASITDTFTNTITLKKEEATEENRKKGGVNQNSQIIVDQG